jgi:hypothetical protein
MTLKEKFVKHTKKFSQNYGWIEDLEDAEECEQIADDFAIGFAEWCQYRCVQKEDLKSQLEIYKKVEGL